jgi:hypothetical protein
MKKSILPFLIFSLFLIAPHSYADEVDPSSSGVQESNAPSDMKPVDKDTFHKAMRNYKPKMLGSPVVTPEMKKREKEAREKLEQKEREFKAKQNTKIK